MNSTFDVDPVIKNMTDRISQNNNDNMSLNDEKLHKKLIEELDFDKVIP